MAGSLSPLAAAEPAPQAAAVRPGYVKSPHDLRPAEVESPDGVVVSGSEGASRAGAAMLEAGGNAIDAAVAAAFALGVTEPMTSGLGAETFILIRLADGRTFAIDGSSYVPIHARRLDLQKTRAAAARGYLQGYESAAVPGSLAALSYALGRYGTKTLAEVLGPAIELADFGYTMSPSSVAEVESLRRYLLRQDYVIGLLLKDPNEAWGPGHVFCASDLANTLRRIAANGAEDFYSGKIADEIDADMRRNGGYIRKDDLERVRAVELQPLRDSYRGLQVITFPYPGGGASLLETLHILEAFPTDLLRGESLDRLHLLIEAARIAWFDGQTSRLPLPLLDQQLADRRWGAERAKLIRFDRALLQSEIVGGAFEPNLALGTTQVSVVDRWGNFVGLSQTLGGFFGATVATPGLGFLYNSHLNAFDFTNPFSPNFLAPRRVPMTTLTPTIVLKDGRPLFVLGGAGSERVVPTIASVISAVADRGLDLREAVATPRAIWGTNWGDPRAFVELAGDITPERVDALEKQGFRGSFRLGFPAGLADLAAFGGTNVAGIDPATGMFVGVPDPRRTGAAAAPRAR